MSKIPTGKIERTLSGGSTAARVGGKMLRHYAKRPFMGADARRRARDEMARDSAQTLFQGLSLLKGTALKMAQMLSLEMDMLPEAACRELAKAYHQVPPINRAVARKVIQDGLGQSPEELFDQFESTAFAAASLGQVHAANAKDGTPLAIKIQYPGIARTIDNDIGMLKLALTPMIQSDQRLPLLTEIADRLKEEVDYRQEAENLKYFANHLKIPGVRIPRVLEELSSNTVLTTTRMPGLPLDQWLIQEPDQDAKDHVARKLHQIFISGLYELHAVHADPNPGNFIIADDLTIGLVDFGCIKRLKKNFVQQYSRLAVSASLREDQTHFRDMIDIGLLKELDDKEALVQVQAASDAFSCWFGKLFEGEVFDFGDHPNFIAQGKEVMANFHYLRRYFHMNADFIFLDRTRYGLLRLFEQMGARICCRNPYEWKESNPA